jgi:hypothetical protein
MPEIKGMLQPHDGVVSLFDVGGDDVGARLLSSFSGHLDKTSAALWQVINARRPFTDTLAGCLKMQSAIERAARMAVTGFIANTHLMSETTTDVILDGWKLARQVARHSQLDVKLVTVMEELDDRSELAEISDPLFRLQRNMRPPWLRDNETPAPEGIGEEPSLPARRPIPIGRPTGAK